MTLTAKLTETVSEINFSDGDYVDKGHVLVVLTNEEQTALLDEAKANFDDAKRQLTRIEGLAQQGSVPISQADEARARHDASRARYEAIVARLDDRLIRAPFAGVLGFRQVSPGTLITPSTSITTIDDVSIIKLDFTIPEVYLAAVRRGLSITAESPAFPGRRFEGSVTNIDSRIDPVTRSAVVRAHIANPDRALRPGMLLTVAVEREKITGLVVRESAVLQVADSAFVYQVIDGHARRTPVETGLRAPGVVEITAGLQEGDVVVTEGMIKLRDGVPVETQAGSKGPSEIT
ncbi:MAG: efflux RND transporter periplasmic adaptor subunit [Gammaproteobacteria bacterium]|nr:efflux RND transporter periplasmic adaptor subunit [Gammaproteobacteria bacterium]